MVWKVCVSHARPGQRLPLLTGIAKVWQRSNETTRIETLNQNLQEGSWEVSVQTIPRPLVLILQHEECSYSMKSVSRDGSVWNCLAQDAAPEPKKGGKAMDCCISSWADVEAGFFIRWCCVWLPLPCQSFRNTAFPDLILPKKVKRMGGRFQWHIIV